jgi:hypothetical protein
MRPGPSSSVFLAGAAGRFSGDDLAGPVAGGAGLGRADALGSAAGGKTASAGEADAEAVGAALELVAAEGAEGAGVALGAAVDSSDRGMSSSTAQARSVIATPVAAQAKAPQSLRCRVLWSAEPGGMMRSVKNRTIDRLVAPVNKSYADSRRLRNHSKPCSDEPAHQPRERCRSVHWTERTRFDASHNP